MSAKTHSLMQQLEELKYAIELKTIKGEDVTDLQEKVSALQKSLISASQMLSEGKEILKG